MVAALVRQTSPGVPMGASDSLLRVRRAWSESLRDSRRRCRRIRHSRISPTSLGDSRAPRAALALISLMALDQAGRVGGSPRAIPVPTVQVLSPGSRWVIRVSSLGSRACPNLARHLPTLPTRRRLRASVLASSPAWRRTLGTRALTRRVRSRAGTPSRSPCRPCLPLVKRR